MVRFEKEGYEYRGYELGETIDYYGNAVRIVGFDEDTHINRLEVLVSYSTLVVSPTISPWILSNVITNLGNDRTVFLEGLNDDLKVFWCSLREIEKIGRVEETTNYYPNKDAEYKVEYKEVFGKYAVKYSDGKVTNVELMSGREFETFKEQIDEMNKPKRWRADTGEKFWYITSLGDVVSERDTRGRRIDAFYNLGNYFESRELAQEKLEQFKNIFK